MRKFGEGALKTQPGSLAFAPTPCTKKNSFAPTRSPS